MNDDGVLKFCRDKTVPQSAPRSCIENFRMIFVSGVFAVVYMFTFVNLGRGPTFFRYLAYYLICGIQNAIVISSWVMSADLTIESVYFAKYLLIASVALFAIGIAAMII